MKHDWIIFNDESETIFDLSLILYCFLNGSEINIEYEGGNTLNLEYGSERKASKDYDLLIEKLGAKKIDAHIKPKELKLTEKGKYRKDYQKALKELSS